MPSTLAYCSLECAGHVPQQRRRHPALAPSARCSELIGQLGRVSARDMPVMHHRNNPH
ncbi:MAG: hypothetical protein ACLP7F_06140 [Acidimicrobiales bacterium]